MYLKMIFLTSFLFFSISARAGQVSSLKLKAPEAEVLVEYGDKKDTKIPVNKLVNLKLIVKSKEELSLTSFDAIMPQHKHGMLTKVQIKKLPDNAYAVSGVKLHMAGHWVFIVNLADKKGKVYTLTENYVTH